MDPKTFVEEKVSELEKIIGNDRAIVALSGGVDSSVAAAIANIAIGDKLSAVFVVMLAMQVPQICWLVEPLFTVTALVTVISGLHYMYAGFMLINRA